MDTFQKLLPIKSKVRKCGSIKDPNPAIGTKTWTTEMWNQDTYQPIFEFFITSVRGPKMFEAGYIRDLWTRLENFSQKGNRALRRLMDPF